MGYLITFEGGECAGKGTHIRLAKKALENLGYSVNASFWEPGSTPKAELLRIVVKNKFDTNFNFSDDIIKKINLENNAHFFENDKISQTCKSYLEDVLKNSNTPLKNEFINFVLTNSLSRNSELEKLMVDLRKDFPQDPGLVLFKDYFTKEVLTAKMQENVFYAARNILFHNYIKDSLNNYDFTIIDRSLDSTAVYQGRVFNPSRIDAIHEENLKAVEDMVPNLTLFLDIPVDEIYERLKITPRGSYPDFFDGQKREFHEKVRQGYHDELKYYENLPNSNREKGRIVRIDTNTTMDDVHQNILSTIKSRYL